MRFLAAMAGHGALLAAFYWWLGLGDDARWKLGLSAFAAIAWTVALIAFERRLFRGRAFDAKWAGVFLASCVAAWLLTHWIPGVTGTGPQLLSFFLRFGLAWALLNFVWVRIGRKAVAPEAHHGLASVTGD